MVAESFCFPGAAPGAPPGRDCGVGQVCRHVLWDFAPYIYTLGNQNIDQAQQLFPAVYENVIVKEQLELKVSFPSDCNFITTDY